MLWDKVILTDTKRAEPWYYFSEPRLETMDLDISAGMEEASWRPSQLLKAGQQDRLVAPGRNCSSKREDFLNPIPGV
jgi:hypothetical protein